jgi:hypothetical protein
VKNIRLHHVFAGQSPTSQTHSIFLSNQAKDTPEKKKKKKKKRLQLFFFASHSPTSLTPSLFPVTKQRPKGTLGKKILPGKKERPEGLWLVEMRMKRP